MTIQPDNNYGSSIWQSGVGPSADSAGNIYISTANGLFDFGDNVFDLGDSLLQLQLGASGFTVADSFTPFDQSTLAADDMDLAPAP